MSITRASRLRKPGKSLRACDIAIGVKKREIESIQVLKMFFDDATNCLQSENPE